MLISFDAHKSGFCYAKVLHVHNVMGNRVKTSNVRHKSNRQTKSAESKVLQ